MTTMESLIGLVNRIQRACTVLGDYGGGTGSNAFNSLWEALPTVAVVGGQVISPVEISLTSSQVFSLVTLQLTFVLGLCRVLGNLRFLRVQLGEIFFLEDLVCENFPFSLMFVYKARRSFGFEEEVLFVQVSLRDGLQCCSFIRLMMEQRSMQSSFIFPRSNSQILVCTLTFMSIYVMYQCMFVLLQVCFS